ncbi:MAG: methyltransferase domain-containing protein [Thermodesulfobacteriota bacterium]
MAEGNVDEVRAQFTRQAEVYARMRQATDQKGLDGLVALSGAKAGDRALDVACGPGFLTMTLATRASHATGFDATEAMLDLARAEAARRGLANVEFLSGDAEALPFPDASFDVLCCRAAFHHFARPGRVLAEMVRVACPGAKLLIADMLGPEDATKAAYRDRMERLCDPSHAHTLSEAELRALFEAAGLGIAFAATTPFEIDVEDWIAHGGPSAEVAAELRELVAACLDDDRAGIVVRRVGDRLAFSYDAAAFVLSRPA